MKFSRNLKFYFAGNSYRGVSSDNILFIFLQCLHKICKHATTNNISPWQATEASRTGVWQFVRYIHTYIHT